MTNLLYCIRASGKCVYGQFGTSDTAMIFPTGIDVFTVETEIDLYFCRQYVYWLYFRTS